MCPCVETDDLDDVEDDTTLCLKLVNKHYFREGSDEEDEEEEEESVMRWKLTMIRRLLWCKAS